MITCVEIFKHNGDQLLLGTNKGSIYLVEFLQIKRFNSSFPYKSYSRISGSLL